LNSLASTTIIDIYHRSLKKGSHDTHLISASKWVTLAWGLFAIGVAQLANRLGSLIEAVNVLGSLFYGNILGIFLIAFFPEKGEWYSYFYCSHHYRSDDHLVVYYECCGIFMAQHDRLFFSNGPGIIDPAISSTQHRLS
jgi:hypothetical protein